MDLQPLTQGDAGEACALWNAELPLDWVTEARFREVFLDPPSYDPASTPSVRLDGRLAGFASLIHAGSTAHVRGMVAAGGVHDVLDPLLEAVTARARHLGCSTIRVVTAHGMPYVYPGIDLRYTAMLDWYAARGFARVEEIKDMRIDLNPVVDREKISRLAQRGIGIVDYASTMLPAMRRFLPAAEVDHWFAPGWEDRWPDGGRSIVAVEHGEILGYADWKTAGAAGEFGPTAVRLDRREQGIGTGLLLTAMQRMRAAGATDATARWVWPVELYSHNGWSVARVFAVLEKPLS